MCLLDVHDAYGSLLHSCRSPGAIILLVVREGWHRNDPRDSLLKVGRPPPRLFSKTPHLSPSPKLVRLALTSSDEAEGAKLKETEMTFNMNPGRDRGGDQGRDQGGNEGRRKCVRRGRFLAITVGLNLGTDHKNLIGNCDEI